MDIQVIAVVLIVAAAILFLGRKARKTTEEGSCDCSSCGSGGSCPAAKNKNKA